METPNLNPDKYRFFTALRPFSFSVALICCGLGIAIAFARGEGDWLRAIDIILCGLLLQAAANLANDYADIQFWKDSGHPDEDHVIKQIKSNFKLAGIFTFTAIGLGLWLVYLVGWELFALGISGIIAGYFYTGEPVVYKHRGFGVPAVFILTGVLMVSASYYGVTGVWDNQVAIISIPVSLITAALLVANELRDYVDDKNDGIGTLTVRMGFDLSRAFYVILLFAVYPVSLNLYLYDFLQQPLFLLLPLLVIWQPIRLLKEEPGSEVLKKLPPLTGRFFMVFGVCFIAVLF
ncbi:prenyltransferase [Endozoicomonas sp. OPT23]|uniref:prenyltransferase n=1 Tax=Endozoicomonas sp. OPT23 TaxID=2072845 RepID=UPI001891880A